MKQPLALLMLTNTEKLYYVLYKTNIKMYFLISIAPAVLFFTCMLWSGVSAQCTDPLIYKLNDIQQLIANLTETIQRLEAENRDLRNDFNNFKTQNQGILNSQGGLTPEKDG